MRFASRVQALGSGAIDARARRRAPQRAGAVLVLLSLVPAAVAQDETPQAAWSAEGDQPGAHFGFSVCSAGDVNRDGYADVLIGAPGYDQGQLDEGTVFLFLGSVRGLLPEPGWSAAGDQPGAGLGSAVASAGDVNGDGYGDVLIGAPGYDQGQEDEGAVFLYVGSANGLTAPARTWHGGQAGARFGASVCGAGDVNGDGLADVLVGAPGFDGNATDEGAASLFLGAASGAGADPAWFAQGNQSGAAFGSALAGLGDLNGDGRGEVMIAAPLYDGGNTDEGQVRVFAGSASGLAANPLQLFEPNTTGTQLGYAVAGAGDLNADGVREILLATPFYDYTHTDEGGTFFANLGLPHTFLHFGQQDFAHRGVSIASAGDVNGDGLLDVVAGADAFDAGEVDEGRATVYLGSGFVVNRFASWTMDGDQAFAAFGASVASAGDVNGDGFDDIVVGAPNYDRGESDEGRAFVYTGPAVVPVGVTERLVPDAPIQWTVHPTPFRGELTVSYTLPGERPVQLSVLDVQGRRRALLADQRQVAGPHTARWDGRDDSGSACPAGIYFVRLAHDRGVEVRRVLLMR